MQTIYYRMHDHGDGFTIDFKNKEIESALKIGCQIIETEYVFDERVLSNYADTKFLFALDFKKNLFGKFSNYNLHPEHRFDKFLCSFNGSPHVGRRLLVAILERMHWFDPDTCTKNFQFNEKILDGHIREFAPDRERFFSKFFIGTSSVDFFKKIYSQDYDRYDHKKNLSTLENMLTRSFIHLISETAPTGYYPFVTEKFLQSVVTRGLFLAYAQPGWHNHLETYYGFRRYNHIFDYRFDDIPNPVERLLELISMISKFSTLGTNAWKDLYEIEKDTIEYNYDWYFSGKYLRRLEEIAITHDLARDLK